MKKCRGEEVQWCRHHKTIAAGHLTTSMTSLSFFLSLSALAAARAPSAGRRRGGDRLGGDNDDNNERVVEEGRVGDFRDSGDKDENKDKNNDRC